MLILIRIFMLLSVAGIVFAQGGKIPITTTSEEARQLYLQGLDLAYKFKNPEARALFEQAVAKDPKFALAYRDLALVQPTPKLFLESLAKAVALADQASECERHSILASDAGANGNFRQQREHLGRLVAQCGQDARAHYEMALYHYSRQQYDSSEVALEQATADAPEFIPAWNMLGYARRSQGDLAGSEEAFLRYIELAPQDANAHDSYAELMLKQGRYDDAVRHYREALVVDSTFTLSRVGMATALAYQGKPDEARRELQEMVGRARDDGERQTAYFNLAMLAADEGKWDEAAQIMEQSSALDEKNNDLASQSQNAVTLAFIRLEQGRYAEARDQFQRAVTLARQSNLGDPAKALVERTQHYGLARIAAAQGDTAAARQHADAFAEKAQAAGSVDDIRALHELYGIVALAAGDYATAERELKQASLQNTYNLYRLARAYEGLGNRAEAARYMQAAAQYNGLLNLNNVTMRREAVRLAGEWNRK